MSVPGQPETAAPRPSVTKRPCQCTGQCGQAAGHTGPGQRSSRADPPLFPVSSRRASGVRTLRLSLRKRRGGGVHTHDQVM